MANFYTPASSFFTPQQEGACYWVPCVPNYMTGAFMPIYSIATYPLNPSPTLAPGRTPLKLPASCWSEEEESRLVALVNELGTRQWVQLAKVLNLEFHGNDEVRKGKHCRERWHNHLNPELNSKAYVEGDWSQAEDVTLLQEQRTKGNKWSKIARALPGRTENAVKNRFHSLLKRAKQAFRQESAVDDEVVARLIDAYEPNPHTPKSPANN